MWQKPPPEAASQIPKCGCKLAHTIVALQAYCLNLVSCSHCNLDLKSNQQKKRKNVRRRRRKEFEKRTKKVVLTFRFCACRLIGVSWWDVGASSTPRSLRMQCPWPPRHEPPPPLEVEGYWAECAGQGGADPHPDNRRSARPWGPWRSSTPLTRPPRLPAPLLRPPQLEYSIPGVLDQEPWW